MRWDLAANATDFSQCVFVLLIFLGQDGKAFFVKVK